MRLFSRLAIDGNGAEKKAIVVETGGEKIIDVKTGVDKAEASNCVMLPEDAVLLPGWIDCHVHLALDGEDFQQSLNRWQRRGLWQQVVEKQLRQTLNCGVVAVRDGSDKAMIGLTAKQLPMSRPDIVACGQAVYQQGRYGSFLGQGVNSLDQVKQLLDKLQTAGADQFKIVLSGLVSFKEYGRVGKVQFDAGLTAAMVAEAHARGMSVMAHASGAAAVDMAVEAAVDTVEHGFYLTTNTIEKMAQKDTVWVPTVVAAAGRLKFQRADENEAVVKRVCEEHLQAISYARQLGVTVAVGTDAGAPGVPHGESFFEELMYLRQAGYTATELVQLGTKCGAAVIGRNELGDIKKGNLASFIAVQGNPLEDINALGRPRFVCHRGNIIKNEFN